MFGLKRGGDDDLVEKTRDGAILRNGIKSTAKAIIGEVLERDAVTEKSLNRDGRKKFLKEIQPLFDKTTAIKRHCLHCLTWGQVVVPGLGNTTIDDRSDPQLIIDSPQQFQDNPEILEQ